MEQPYRDNTLIVKSVGMLPGASAEYTSLSMNVQHIKNRAASIFDTALRIFKISMKMLLVSQMLHRV